MGAKYVSSWSVLNKFFFIIVSLILFSCSNIGNRKEFKAIENGHQEVRGIDIGYPHNGTIFPPEFPAPEFIWNDTLSESTEWQIYISDTTGNILINEKSTKTNWRPATEQWEQIKRAAVNQNINFTVIASKKHNSSLPAARMQFSISKDSVGAKIFYRAVTLPFSYAVKNVHTIEWYIGSVRGSSPKKVLDKLPVCGNCHSFAKDKPLLAMDVDYGDDKGSYVITKATDTSYLKPDDIITWSDYKREDNEVTFGLLSQISPDGNHVLSTVKDLSIFAAIDDNLAYSQLFFPIKGIVGVYNRQTEEFSSLNGANDRKYVQSNPTWSPDGKKVLFAKTDALVYEKAEIAGRALLSLDDVKEFKSGEQEFKYDLYTVDFNNGKGGEAKPLKGASLNGKSNYFPKFSPDGKWIVFCQAENFMLLQPDSKLYIMPAEGGEPRLMNCNTTEMNSWHSWSPNGRWIVFSSKNRSLYTQLYLTHIDENGMDSPPVLLENLSFESRAANIPEFYPYSDEKLDLLIDDFSKTTDYYKRGAFDNMSNKYYKRAMDNLTKAIELDSNNIEAYFNRIILNNKIKQSKSNQDRADKKKAMQLINDSLALNRDAESFLALKISLLSSVGKGALSINEAKRAISLYPESYKLYELLAAIYKEQNNSLKAIECYRKMLKIKPKNKISINLLIVKEYMNIDRYNEALDLVNEVLVQSPDNVDLLLIKSQILMQMQRYNLAFNDILKVIKLDSHNYDAQKLLLQYYVLTGDKQAYNVQKDKAFKVLTENYERNKQDVELVFEMASIYLATNDYDKAEEQYNIILSQFPNNYEALKQQAIINLNRQNWHDAVLIYDQLEDNYPLEEGFCNNKAIAFIQLGNFEKALEYFNKTLTINPNNKDALFNRDKLLKETENN